MWGAHAKVSAVHWYGIVEQGAARSVRAWDPAEVAKSHDRHARECVTLLPSSAEGPP